MFYHNFILAKKGPLAKVWLAAHWEKKLSKAHVFETDVKSSVDSIMSPKVKMALRTSGHLLLGVVRIYSRKAKYLLADCTEAFVKIKMAFRPGVVDLPEESQELAFSAVTLPEVFTDLDMMLPEINEVDIQAQLTLNQSRIEEITMKEDIVTVGLIGDDGFGDIPFDDNEKEILRAGSAADDSLFTSKDQSKLITIDEPNETKDIKDNLLDSRLDDDFGGEGVDFLKDGFGEEVIGMDDLQTTLPDDVPLAPLDTNLDHVDEPDKIADESKEKEISQEDEENLGSNEPGNETTLVQNDAEAFVLEPVEVVHKEKRSRRKRKLIVDEDKILATDAIKAQLSDTSDILKPATLAPPSKKRMQLQVTSTVDKLMSIPSHSFSITFQTSYAKKLVQPKESKQSPKSPEEELESDEPEVNRKADESDVLDVSKRSRVSFEEEKATDTSLPEPMELDVVDVTMPVDEQMDVHMSGVEDILPNDNEINEVQEPELPSSQMNDEKLTNETEEQFETRRWTKRTQQLLQTLKREFKKEKVVSFEHISHRNNRKQAAYKFYGCLLLSKESSVVVKQKKPFGDILLSKGQNFGLVC